MSNHCFHEIFLHITWHTKDSYPLITASIESEVHSLLRKRCGEAKGVWLHALNGTPNHVHIAISIEPTVTISDFIGQLKGGSAFDFNKTARMKRMEWQRGYGVVSFGKLNLPWVTRYIDNQKEHHGCGTQIDRLERFCEYDEGEGYDARSY
ncbi:IS200/IS605 family transposase [Anatilimnocola floriformis]|uniref:IS200/IS605 family transposase n=1 Tax=Anatilimnocola floriformis TaxID=2948575 RepID=UPI0020C4048A|nr:IS200/IS605 family transposase [Anatilimnocola floriformis]